LCVESTVPSVYLEEILSFGRSENKTKEELTHLSFGFILIFKENYLEIEASISSNPLFEEGNYLNINGSLNSIKYSPADNK